MRSDIRTVPWTRLFRNLITGLILGGGNRRPNQKPVVFITACSAAGQAAGTERTRCGLRGAHRGKDRTGPGAPALALGPGSVMRTDQTGARSAQTWGSDSSSARWPCGLADVTPPSPGQRSEGHGGVSDATASAVWLRTRGPLGPLPRSAAHLCDVSTTAQPSRTSLRTASHKSRFEQGSIPELGSSCRREDPQ